jgi:hypothetical protein
LTPERVNLRLRLRFDKGYLLEIHEAVIIDNQNLMHLDYCYRCQDEQNCLVFRYDCTPHFPELASFFRIINTCPMPVIISERLEIGHVSPEVWASEIV